MRSDQDGDRIQIQTSTKQAFNNMDDLLLLRGIYLGAAASVRKSHVDAMSIHG